MKSQLSFATRGQTWGQSIVLWEGEQKGVGLDSREEDVVWQGEGHDQADLLFQLLLGGCWPKIKSTGYSEQQIVLQLPPAIRAAQQQQQQALGTAQKLHVLFQQIHECINMGMESRVSFAPNNFSPAFCVAQLQ